MSIPIPVIIWMSFFNADYLIFPPSNGYSTRWYEALPFHTQFMSSFGYSMMLALAAASLATALGFLAAYALNRSPLGRSELLSSLVTAPLAVPTIVASVALYLFLYDIQKLLGMHLVPSFWTLVAAHVVITLPWAFRFIYSGLQGQAMDAERASLDLGYGPVATLFKVTLPILRPALVGGFILAFVFSFSDLEMGLFLVSPGQVTLPIALLQYAQFSVDPLLAVMSVVQIVIIGVLLAIADRFINFGKIFAGGTKG